MSATAFQARHPGLVWSNSQASESVCIRAALLRPRFHTVLDACLEFGLERVRHEWEVLASEAAPEARRAAPEITRMLRHIAAGFADAQAGD